VQARCSVVVADLFPGYGISHVEDRLLVQK